MPFKKKKKLLRQILLFYKNSEIGVNGNNIMVKIQKLGLMVIYKIKFFLLFWTLLALDIFSLDIFFGHFVRQPFLNHLLDNNKELTIE